MDPVTIFGLIASLVEVAKASTEAMEKLSRSFPESSRFWKHFEAALKNDRDVPWNEIRNRSYLQPQFFGLSVALVLGDAEAREKMEQHFASFIEPPEGGRYDKSELVRRIMVVAEKAASEAAGSDRAAGLADRRLIEARIELAKREVLAATGSLQQGVERVQAQLDQQAAAQGEFAGATDSSLRHIIDLLTPGAVGSLPAPRGEALDRAQMEELLERQAEEITRRNEAAIATLYESRQIRQIEAAGVQPVEANPVPDEPAQKRPIVGPPPGTPERSNHVVVLRDADPEAADRLVGLLEAGGVFAVATAIRNGDLDDGPLDLLVAAARIVAEGGFAAEAEAAFLSGVALADSSSSKARQYVRAASMATVLRSEERFRRHLDAARELVPDHPALLIAEARASADSQFMLDHVKHVEPENDAERALLHQTRAQALLGLGDEDGAREQHGLALAADSDNPSVREFGAILPWFLAHRQIEHGQPVDLGALQQAATTFEELAAEVTAEGRIDEAAKVLARAAECRLFANEFQQAERILDGVAHAERLSLDSALALASAAVLVNRSDLVLRFVPSAATEPLARLVRAEALVLMVDAEARVKGAAELQELLDNSDEQIALQAAFGLISASATHEDVAWDERAAELVASHKREAEAVMRAERALLLGDPEEAQRILLPYSGRPPTLRRLRDYAAVASDWEKVKDRSRQLLRQFDDPRDRLALAEALRHLGARNDAEREYGALARDAGAPAELRQAGFGGMAEVAGVDRDYEAIRSTAEQWHREFPDNPNALWNLLFALARLSRYDEAWALFETNQPVADTPTRATLLGEILQRAAPKGVALRLLIELSDLFGREVEALEALIIATSLDAEHDEVALDPAVEERVRETFASFPTRFPDSKVIRAVPMPESSDEIASFLKEMVGDRPRLQQEISEAIAAGRAPVNALAAVSTGGVGKAWSRIHALPLRFATAEQDDDDDQTAREQLGGAAVWDPSALFVVAALVPELEQTIRLALPGSMIVTEALEDADSDIRTPGRPMGETFHTVEGDFGVHEFTEEELGREERRAQRTLELARVLEVLPAKGPGVDQRLVEDFERSEEQHDFKVLFGTLLLAQRSGRAIYSDDRFIRQAARSLGVSAFDTLGLLGAMAHQGFIEAEEREAARRSLAVRGAWGIRLTGDELVAVAREYSFALTTESGAVVRDRARWRSDPGETCRSMLVLLTGVHDHDPAALADWLPAIVSAAQGAAPEMSKSWWIDALLISTWLPLGEPVANREGEEDKRSVFLQALLDAAKGLGPELKDAGYDPVLGPISRILANFAGHDPDERLFFLRALTDRLSQEDQERAIATFVEPTDDDELTDRLAHRGARRYVELLRRLGA